MTYVLEKITLEDQGKIINDAKSDPEKHRGLVSRPLLSYNPGATWAIDRSKNTYFYIVFGSSMDQGSVFNIFYKNSLYQIELEGGLEGSLVRFIGKKHPVQPILGELQHEICCAFAVYGRFGAGVKNGDWMMTVAPIFESEE